MHVDWSKLFRSEKARIKPVLMRDVGIAPVPNKDLELHQESLGLKLLKGVVDAAIISGKIREGVAAQVALQVQGGGNGENNANS